MPQNNTHEFFTSDEFKKMSQPLQDYVRAVFGLMATSHEAEKELWERLSPDEQRHATEIARRMVARVKEKNNFLHHE